MEEVHCYSSYFLEWIVGSYHSTSFPLSSSNPRTQQEKSGDTVGWENSGGAGIVVMVVMVEAGGAELPCCADIT